MSVAEVSLRNSGEVPVDRAPRFPRKTRGISGRSIAILVFLAAYVWIAVVVGDRVPDHWAARLAYFAIVGTAWGVPLIPLLSWIAKGR